MSALRYDGKVVVVTGAGGGLGKEYALLFAQRGASVVVNDLGGSTKGDGQSHSPADIVVNEIKAKGGKAVANYDSVEDGDKIIKTAVDAFGRVDIVINNAGILRDRSFLKQTDQDWDLIHRVHLRGAFMVTRAAWPYMRDQAYGRIIMTASGAGIYGNFGQSNYSAAKMGLIGLSNSLAVEGAKYNIHSNVIIPIAASRLTQGILPPDVFDKMKPEFVAPVVAWLCHDNCEDNGGVYEAAGGWVGKYRWQRSVGETVALSAKDMSVEKVRDCWNKAIDMTNGNFPLSVQENIGMLAESINNAQEEAQVDEDDDDGTVNVEKVLATKFPTMKYSYCAKDVILYALGVGITKADDNFLKFVYEGSVDFCPLPTYAVIPAQAAMMESGVFTGRLRGINIDLSRVLHGEQYVEFLGPLPTSETLESRTSIVDVLDKGSGAAILINVDSYDSKGNHLIRNQFVVFAVGAGGFGGKKQSNKAIPAEPCPGRQPDAVLKSKTTVDQPALYRLNGDWNPLHIDPNFSALGGFAEPILHGLCSFGLAGRHVLKAFANDDVTKFKAIKARFTKPVLPGNTLQTEMWKNGNRVIFRSKIVDNGNIAIVGFVDLDPSASASTEIKMQKLESDELFTNIASRVASAPDLAKNVNGCFQWNITKDGSIAQIWTMDLKGTPTVQKGKSEKPDTILTVSDEDMVAIGTGKLKPQAAFMNGKLKVQGNVMLTQKLQSLFQQQANL